QTSLTTPRSAGKQDATIFDLKQGEVQRKENTTLRKYRQTATTPLPYKENTSVSSTTKHNTAFNQSAGSENPRYWACLVSSQLVLSIVGYLANKITFITLLRNGDMFSSSICILLKHQALVDSWICAMGTILLLQPPMWTTGNTYFDAAVCYLWHNQSLFWGAILLSVWNLAAIAVERYMAVCRPFVYNHVQRQHVYYSFAAMYIANIVIILPGLFQVRFDAGVCLREFLIQGPIGEQLFYAYSLVWFFAVYLLPVTSYVCLYGKVIITLYRKKSCSKAIDSAQSTITKTAFTLTVIFVFAIGFDAWAYLLGYTGVVEYEIGSTKQEVGMFFSLFNSVVNPFVYLVLMPPFRLSLKKTFPRCIKNKVATFAPTEHRKTKKISVA
ncbi:hypothetical protein LSAT2_028393, partial [Lamellibrachia satsuma]